MQVTTNLDFGIPSGAELSGRRAERREKRQARRAERRELKSDRKNRRTAASTRAERRDMRQTRRNDRVANRHEFRMSDNFREAAQARSQIAAGAMQTATGLVASFTGRGGGGGFPQFQEPLPPTHGGGNFQNDFNDDPRPQPRGLFGPRPLIRGVPDIITVGGAALLFFTLSQKGK